MGEYRSLFLKEFTKELILNIDKIDLGKEGNIENFDEISERIRKEILEQIEREYEYNKIKNQEIVPKSTIKIKPLPTIKESLKPLTKDYMKTIPNKVIPKPTIQQPPIKFNSTDEIIYEIKKIFNDPRVTGVECSGKDQFLLVKTATKVMSTKIKLTEEEIREVIYKFSKDTKIPIINGILNATKDNLLISAIISDVAGSKFLIKKVYLES